MAVDAARAKSLFLAASDLADAAERAAYLERECGGDAELRARVEALLRANDAAPLPVAPEATVDSAPGQPETEDHGDPTARVGAVLAGKYKLVEAIGEGGMGSVFLAQQTEPVKRAVAVKVIKAGMDSKAVLARFEAERQALALMDHPNIARVLDAGTTEGGRPFFVMELVKGVPITRYCDEHRLTPRQRLELFVPVCQAIQHAHQKGVIHRDIKPSNVLVALYDDRAVPKVIDFGLAKAAGQSLTDRTLMTGLGAIVGTPEYMSPEQASLNNLDIDTRSDVYSLGVLLYELLTGTTPVDRKSLGKAALLEILRIVREVEAPRPSTKLSSSDMLPSVAANRGTEAAKLARLMKGELDWLVLKALEKDRSRRYDTANALARDVQRYLADEVVEARPPSVGYRVSKFVRRHKGQVIAASLVLLALVVGIVGTTLGLFEARRQERIARDETAEKQKALQAEAEAHAGLAQANDNLLNVGARGLLRPLAAHAQPNQPLNYQEVEALWELGTAKDERLRLRFVELALEGPVSRQQLKDRAPFAFQAAVGLGPRRRTRVEELLGQRLQARDISPQEQEQMAFCLAHLGGLDGRLAGRVADALIQAMRKPTGTLAVRELAQALSAVSACLGPKEAAVTLIQAMSNTGDGIVLQSLAKGLSAVAARLEPKEAAEVAAILIQAISKTTERDRVILGPMAQGLSSVAARLERKEAAEVAATLTQAMRKTKNDWALATLAHGVSAVAARLEPKEAAEVAATLTQAISKTLEKNTWPDGQTPTPLPSLAQGLSAVSDRLEPKEAAELAATLTQAMRKTTNDFARATLAHQVSAVSARLEPKEAARLCRPAAAILIEAMSKYRHWDAVVALGQGLLAVAARLGPKEAAANLLKAMSKTTDWRLLAPLVQGLSAGLEPKEAAKVAATLIQEMSRPSTNDMPGKLARCLSEVAARMEPKDAARVCGQAAATLTKAMTTTTDPYFVRDLAQGLSAVSARLERKKAAELAATLTQAMSNTADANVLPSLAEGLSAVAARLEPGDATRVCAQAAAILTQAMNKATEGNHLWGLTALAQGLSAVSARLGPKEAAQLCRPAAASLTQAMNKALGPGALHYPPALLTVSARLEPKEAAQLCRQAAATLTQAMNKAQVLPAPAHVLSAVSARLEPKEAAQLCGQAAAIIIQGGGNSGDLSAMLARDLPPPTLVELLKHPFCVGDARRLVLDALARHYRRPFADQWDFVDYAQQQKLGLDLTRPPARQGPSRR
jgi:serine/threonine protein kinase/tRNA 2-selenouridine synthase SelU